MLPATDMTMPVNTPIDASLRCSLAPLVNGHDLIVERRGNGTVCPGALAHNIANGGRGNSELGRNDGEATFAHRMDGADNRDVFSSEFRRTRS